MTPKEKKYIKYGAIALGIGTILYLVTKSNKDTNSQIDPTGNGDVINPNNPASFSATKIANDLYEACITTGYASFINPNQKETIFNLLRNVNPAQFADVVRAFGQRFYNPTWGNDYFAVWSAPEKHTLPYILKKELQLTDYNVLRQKYPNSL